MLISLGQPISLSLSLSFLGSYTRGNMFIFLVSASLTQQVIVRSSRWMLSCSRCQIINSTIRCRMITQYLSFGPHFFYICAPCSYPILTGKKCKNAWPVSTQEMGSTFCSVGYCHFPFFRLSKIIKL
jgi:hypothetical protein